MVATVERENEKVFLAKLSEQAERYDGKKSEKLFLYLICIRIRLFQRW